MPVTINGSTGLTANNGSVFTDASGNVGIGTGTPTSNVRLDVVSSATNQQYVDVLRLKTSNTGDFHPSILFENNRNGIANAAEIATDSATTAGSSVIIFRLKDSGGTFNTRATLNNSGAFVLSAQPAFLARMNGGGGTLLTGNIVYPTVTYNIGNNYNASTGAFTAPVSGRYLFYVHCLPATGSSSGSPARITITRNGSAYPAASPATQIRGNDPDMTYDMVMVIECATNDVVRVNVVSGNINDDIPYQHFGGYLLG